ncbi:MAG: hypothetical protein H6Q54_1151 [Deltaproteobacteria bacterium]|nr:hypothetical protein [Deltaproteobacteria bacterium]
MEQQGGLKQPALGILGTVVCVFIAFGIITWFKPETFIPWAGELAMCLIPCSIIMGMVWQGNYPAPAATLAQPFKGTYLLFFNMLIGALVAGWSIKTVGAFVTPPTPPLMKGAPFYEAVAPPSGAFFAFWALAFFLTCLAVILAWVELDFWPLSSIPPKAPAFGKQPIWGIVVSIIVIIVALIIQRIFIDGMGMDIFVYTLKVPICIIFGEFIMLLLMQTWPVQTVKQPGKGIVLIILNIILAVVMYYIYYWFHTLVAGVLPSGGPAGYVQELWIATALLGFTFPVIASFTGFFNFWPLTEPKPPQG